VCPHSRQVTQIDVCGAAAFHEACVSAMRSSPRKETQKLGESEAINQLSGVLANAYSAHPSSPMSHRKTQYSNKMR
jgi:hypothetical protein